MSFNPKEMGSRIRNERLKNKLTIESLCEILEVSPSFIGLVERGDSGISLEKLCRLSEIFRVSTDYLLKGEGEAKSETHSSIDALSTFLYNYNDDELDFVCDLLKFLKPRIEIKDK